jgi:uncharacterized NAD-dependent epimerase/dehydratase family protein
MNSDNNSIVYCEGAFNTPNGKTAHGLVRFTKRYHIAAVIDSNYAGKMAGDVLDGVHQKIPIFAKLEQALDYSREKNIDLKYFIVGLAPDGGRMDADLKRAVKEAIRANLNIDSGLHDFLSDDNDIVNLAKEHKIQLRDIRKPPERNDLHFFSGKIEEVMSLKIAVLGTDSAIGKRTSAWILVNALKDIGIKTEFIGTGQTAWMQGATYSIMLDSLINDFLTGEIEHAVWLAWKEQEPDIIVIEGQGSLLNPAYPGGYEILAAARPDLIILQHAPARKEYDGFPGYQIQPLEKQIAAIEMISDKPVIAIAINHENLNETQIKKEVVKINKKYNLPAFDLLLDGGDELSRLVLSKMKIEQNRIKN